MPHPSDGHMFAWLDGEMEPGDGAGVREHLESCAECRNRAEALRRQSEEFSQAMILLDEHGSGLADPGPLPFAAALPVGRHRLRFTGWTLARAAGLVLVAAGAAAALVPGSPVRDWFEGLSRSGPPVGGVPAVRTPDAEAPAEAARGSSVSAVSVEPVEGGVTVSLHGFDPSSNVHVRLTDAGRATVRVEDAPESPRYVTAPGMLEVIGAREGEIWVELPRSVRDAVVLVDGEAAVRIEGGRLVILWPVLDSLRGDVVFRIGG
ncbi:MAG: zf-HC2 domain-containing protein [Candidatus Palauibacterales bacterium]|nr:zf-HC2 domain-containing protein [Candidatus Palauibacterales bacterium]MDP2482911.1 zf-HC2 domain-containing protein [Candidatus Palauibacterales bacterium]